MFVKKKNNFQIDDEVCTKLGKRHQNNKFVSIIERFITMPNSLSLELNGVYLKNCPKPVNLSTLCKEIHKLNTANLKDALAKR